MSGSNQVNPDDHQGYVEVPTIVEQDRGQKDAFEGLPSVGSMLCREVEREKRNIWKNVSIITFSFTLLFTAQSVVAVLQSSLNSEGGLGVISQATIHVAQIISSMFIPTWMIKKLNLKWTMVISQLCHSAYVAVQFYPSFFTLIPAAILLGTAAAPLWSAQATYLTQVGIRYAALIGERNAEPSVSHFFGVFSMGVSSCIIWGSLLNSAILSMGDAGNKTELNLDEASSNCGAHFCLNTFMAVDGTYNSSGNGTDGTEGSFVLQKPLVGNIQMLFGILLGLSLLAVLIFALLVDRTARPSKTSVTQQTSGWDLVIATLRHARNPYQIFIIPLTFFSGFSLAFLTADFSLAYVVCSSRVENIGYVLLCYGTVCSIGSLICGSLVKLIGRMPIILLGCCLSFSLLVTMLFWVPHPTQPETLFILSGLWGFTFSVWHTQLNSLYGVIFRDNKEPAFSNFRLWQSLGYAIAFAITAILCVRIKLYMMIGIILLGTAGYLTIEWMEWKKTTRI